ncbi:MAG: prolyl oligopeptidase family serine peptidase [Nitrospiraceae bacterium]|nr:prolyl oligopeptidase family serine peptidase [Nitrospiraceae bacterium]
MANRYFSPYEYYRKRAERHVPSFAFAHAGGGDFPSWHRRARAKFIELLGPFPKAVSLNPDVECLGEEGGLIRERVILDAEPDMSIPCVVLRPSGIPADGRGAAIVCSHGHGPFGKEPVAGNRTTEALADNIRQHNYDYGEQMARRGFLTLSLDLRGFGERAGMPPGFEGGRDACNLNFLSGAMLGRYPLTLNVWDVRCCIRYLATRPEVDAERIGMMGLSQGGTMTAFAAAALPEIKCTDIIGYLNPWQFRDEMRAAFLLRQRRAASLELRRRRSVLPGHANPTEKRGASRPTRSCTPARARSRGACPEAGSSPPLTGQSRARGHRDRGH